MAGDCPLPGFDERQLSGKPPLKRFASAAIGDPKQKLNPTIRVNAPRLVFDSNCDVELGIVDLD
jgi:hypothetical protein